MSKRMVLWLVLGSTLVSSFALAAPAGALARENRMAKAEALLELRQSRGNAETNAFRQRLAALARHGLKVGPLCITISSSKLERSRCTTQRELGYRSSEYFSIDGIGEIPKAGIYTSIAEARFPGDAYVKAGAYCEAHGIDLMTLFVALEAKERLEHAFLASYTRRNPNTPPRTDGSIHHTYSWAIDQDGHVVEVDHAEGDGD